VFSANFTFTEVNQLFSAFKDFTSNNSCMVSKEQFGNFLEPLGIETTPRNIDSFYNRFKKSDDTVCLKEFVSSTTTCVDGNQEKIAEIQFQVWDSDNDGKLNKEEYLEMLPFSNPSKLSSSQIKSAGNQLFYTLQNDDGTLGLNEFKKGIYITQKEFGANKPIHRQVRSQAQPPLIKWGEWTFWDYLALFSGLSLSFNLFLPW